MRTGDLIHDLAQQGGRVRPMPQPLVRFMIWVAASILCMGLGIFALGIRSDLAAEWHSELFLVQAALAIGLAAASAGSALVLSVPGSTKRLHTLLPAVLLLAWTAVLVGSLLTTGHTESGQGLHCARNVAVLTLIPGVLLFCILRAAAPLRSNLVGLLAAMGAASLGCLATRFVCHTDDPVHVLVWHYIPILGLSAMGGLLGRLAFSKNANRQILANS